MQVPLTGPQAAIPVWVQTPADPSVEHVSVHVPVAPVQVTDEVRTVIVAPVFVAFVAADANAAQVPVTVPQEAKPEAEHAGAAPIEAHVSEHVPAVGNVHGTVAVRLVIVVPAVPETTGAVQLLDTVPQVAKPVAAHVAGLPTALHVSMQLPVGVVHGYEQLLSVAYFDAG